MDVLLRGKERAHRNGTPPDSPLRSGSMLYPFNDLQQTEREIERQKKLDSIISYGQLQNRMK